MTKKSLIRSAAVALTALLTLSVAACNGSPASSGEPGGKDKASQLEAEKGKKLTFMLPAFDYQDDSKFENQVLKAFKEQYPDTKAFFLADSCFPFLRLHLYSDRWR